MKPYLIIIIACLSFLSCSKSEDEEEKITYVDATVNGTLHMFNTFFVDRQTITEDGTEVPIITLAASIENIPNRVMSFKFREAVIGFDACTSVKFIEDGKVYERFDDTFEIEIVESNSYRIRGVFSGKLKNMQTGEVVEVTGGGVDVFYHLVIP